MVKLYTGLVLSLLLVFHPGCQNAPKDYRSEPPDPEWLHASVKQLTDAIVYDIFSPPQASRAYAYASIAAYEALLDDQPGFRSLAGQLNDLTPVPRPEPDQEHYLPLASVHAFLTVGKALTFSQDRMEIFRREMHDRFRSLGIPAAVFERSVAYGETVAQHVLEWASRDYFAQTRGYPKFTVMNQPGRWIPTPPAYMDAIEPNWHRVRPFALDSANLFRPAPPLAYDMTPGSPFYRQVREVYETRVNLKDDQREIAAFWDCNPYVMHLRGHVMFATKKITPGGHWIGITAIAARQAELDLMRAAEAYARVSVALADGFISSWEEKYRSNVVRPETVIHAYFDTNWEPLLQTPPFPEYTSGHSVISTAAAAVLTDLFGEPFAFEDTTEVEYGLPVRSFNSFNEAAAEAAISRLYGGIHYMMAIDAGIEQGSQVGRHVLARVTTRSDDDPEQVATTGR